MSSSWHYCCGPSPPDLLASGGHLCTGWVPSLHRPSAGPLEAHPALHILEGYQLPSAFFSSSQALPALLSSGLLLHGARGHRNHVDHLSLVAAKLLLYLQQHRACKFPHVEHLSLASVVGDHQKCSKRSGDPNSTLGWAATAPLKLQAGAGRNECWV